MMIEKDYGVKIENEDTAKKVFVNLEILAGYISEQSAGGGH
jgi:acyl carrier protein